MSKKLSAFLKSITAVTLALTLAGSALATTQEEIDALQASSEAIAAEKAEIRAKLNSVQSESMSTLARKNALDHEVELSRQEIDTINESIAAYDTLIAEKTAEVEAAKKAEEEQRELYLARIRAMEEYGTISYIAIIFEAESFSDFLSRVDLVVGIIKNDERICEELKAAEQETADAMSQLQTAQEAQKEKRAEAIKKESELESQVIEARELIASQMNDIESYNAFIIELNEKDAEIEAEISAKIEEYERQRQLEREAEERARREAEQNQTESEYEYEDGSEDEEEYSEEPYNDSDLFIWPAPSCYIVTSPFGMRSFPLTGEYRMHYGVDIGASWGENVLAADGGYVIMAEEHWSYGNFCMISHDNGYVTLYAHMSSMNVSAGDTVSRGDVIGYIGDTGEATGPHLHFEVRYDGERIDPLQFFSGYEIWD